MTLTLQVIFPEDGKGTRRAAELGWAETTFFTLVHCPRECMQAGTYGVLILFGVIPSAMIYSERYWQSTLTTIRTIACSCIPLSCFQSFSVVQVALRVETCIFVCCDVLKCTIHVGIELGTHLLSTHEARS
jgi:hypothetical protein